MPDVLSALVGGSSADKIHDIASDISFTPTIIGLTTSGTGTYTTRVGTYSKVGRVVFIHINLAWSNHTGTGNMAITGLPFTSISSADQFIPYYTSNLTTASANYPQGLIRPSTTQIELGRGSTGQAALAVAMDTSATIIIQGFYFASS